MISGFVKSVLVALAALVLSIPSVQAEDPTPEEVAAAKEAAIDAWLNQMGPSRSLALDNQFNADAYQDVVDRYNAFGAILMPLMTEAEWNQLTEDVRIYSENYQAALTKMDSGDTRFGFGDSSFQAGLVYEDEWFLDLAEALRCYNRAEFYYLDAKTYYDEAAELWGTGYLAGGRASQAMNEYGY